MDWKANNRTIVQAIKATHRELMTTNDENSRERKRLRIKVMDNLLGSSNIYRDRVMRELNADRRAARSNRLITENLVFGH